MSAYRQDEKLKHGRLENKHTVERRTRMKRDLNRIFLSAIVVLTVMALSSCTMEKRRESTLPEGYKKADIKLGGQLYDKWYKIKKVEVSGNHPSYPAIGKKKGANTWRCKECHGWDYIGKDGRYKKGSHYTGIKGVYDVKTKSPGELYGALTNARMNHDFSNSLTDSDTWALVRFIREGLIDIGTVVNPDGSAKGNPGKGRPLYQSTCASADCHGSDGNKIDFNKKKEGAQGVGWLAKDNPQETLHKIRWGHPGSDMASAIVDEKLSDADTIDILSYVQTLK